MKNVDIFAEIRNRSPEYIKEYIVSNVGDANYRNSAGITPLHFAVEHMGNANVVKVLISMGANVNTKANGGLAPLHIAVIWGNIEIVEILVSNGANVNISDDNGFTPLHMAAFTDKTGQGRNLDIAKVLVAKGANVNAKTNVNAKGESYSPLHFARDAGNTAMVQYLSSMGAR